VKRRQRNRALKRKRVNLNDLDPKIAAGITVGATAKEAHREFPTQPVTSGVDAQAILAAEPQRVNRVPVVTAVLKDSLDSVWMDEPTGRVQRDAVIMVNPEVREAMAKGWICLRCWEPQDEAFPPPERAQHLEGCTYPISERQAIDVRIEFRGNEHLGPNAGISVYLEEQEERHKRARELAGWKT